MKQLSIEIPVGDKVNTLNLSDGDNPSVAREVFGQALVSTMTAADHSRGIFDVDRRFDNGGTDG